MNNVLEFFQLASKRDLDRLDRKLGNISRKLGEPNPAKRSKRE